MNALPAADDRLLLTLAWLHLATSRQLCRRFYSMGSLTYVESRLLSLHRQGFVARRRLKEVDPQATVSDFVWTLTVKGRQYANSRGVSISQRFKQSEWEVTRGLDIPHTLAVNDVIISLYLMDEDADLTFITYMHEREIRELTIPAKPDAWIHLARGEQNRIYLLEVDRGTEDRRHVTNKIGRLIELFTNRDAMTQAFGSDRFYRVLFDVASDRRGELISDWIRFEVARRGNLGLARAFVIAPHESLTDPGWCSQNL